jgi:hypothetical protein
MYLITSKTEFGQIMRVWLQTLVVVSTVYILVPSAPDHMELSTAPALSMFGFEPEHRITAKFPSAESADLSVYSDRPAQNNYDCQILMPPTQIFASNF